jgi:hypothetical protein
MNKKQMIIGIGMETPRKRVEPGDVNFEIN